MVLRASTLISLTLALFLLAACQSSRETQDAAAPGSLRVLAVESFLADLAQQVAGDRLRVETLIPVGLDPHAFEPTPQDVARIADADVLIVNGAGFEEWLAEVLDNAGGERLVIEAAAGLRSRAPAAAAGADAAQGDGAAHDHAGGDPHFWLDPTQVITYTANIRDGLSQADPANAATYRANAAAYSKELADLDRWIADQIATIPPARRLLVTNHESFGYYADRYGLRVIGAVIPSVSTNAAASAQQLAQLADQIRATGAPAIFLETGANPQLADQLALETGVTVVTGLYSHSVSAAGGPAPGYLDLMRYNTEQIAAALK